LKDKNRLLKVYVPATSASLPRLFLLRPLTVLLKQTRQAVHTIKQSILLRCPSSKKLSKIEIEEKTRKE
jgi:hypothetical protein